MVVIVDYGMGNVGSIRNMLSRLGGESIITSDADVIAGAAKVILPGVGAFDVAMARLKALSLVEVLHERALEARVPILGICPRDATDDTWQRGGQATRTRMARCRNHSLQIPPELRQDAPSSYGVERHQSDARAPTVEWAWRRAPVLFCP